MKKTIAVILAIIMLIAALSGCAAKKTNALAGSFDKQEEDVKPSEDAEVEKTAAPSEEPAAEEAEQTAAPSAEPAVAEIDKSALPPVNDEEFSFPTPGAGEKLYIGTGNFSGVTRFYLAFIVSADGKSIHDSVIRGEDMPMEFNGASVTATVTETTKASYDLPASGGELKIGNSTAGNLKLDDNGGSCDFHYIYTQSTSNGGMKEIDMGTSEVTFTNYSAK